MRINTKSENRVAIVCREQGLTQKKLGEIIFLTEQSVNRIVKGHVKLTKENATRIVQAFPLYRIEWLLGLSDYKTNDELFNSIHKKAKIEHERRIDAIRALAELRGYTLDLYYSTSGVGGDAAETYIVSNGKTNKEISLDLLIDEIADFVDFKLMRFLKKEN